MAKLSANGIELLRIEAETEITDPERAVTWARATRTYHSNGKILQKLDVRFKPTSFEPKGEYYSYGWKLYGKLKKGIDPKAHVAKIVANLHAKGTDTKWHIITGGTAPVIIEQSRIIRAIESGKSIGFCKECGHSQDGCEPDARNYTCESCGACAVYGAEEMLIGA